jgi:hypothetical protein
MLGDDPVDRLQERDELCRTVARQALADLHLKAGEAGGAVPLVIVRRLPRQRARDCFASAD